MFISRKRYNIRLYGGTTLAGIFYTLEASMNLIDELNIKKEQIELAQKHLVRKSKMLTLVLEGHDVDFISRDIDTVVCKSGIPAYIKSIVDYETKTIITRKPKSERKVDAIKEFNKLEYPDNVYWEFNHRTATTLPIDAVETVEYIFSKLSDKKRNIATSYFKYKLSLDEVAQIYGHERYYIRECIKSIISFVSLFSLRLISGNAEFERLNYAQNEQSDEKFDNDAEYKRAFANLPLKSIYVLELDKRTFRCLEDEHIYDLAGVLIVSKKHLDSIHSLGLKSIDKIRSEMRKVYPNFEFLD
jgi:predicted DNA-binding protein YlxM (UPF0122 family)/small nuclear ribonucleoprotein (snRNP)-like protein